MSPGQTSGSAGCRGFAWNARAAARRHMTCKLHAGIRAGRRTVTAGHAPQISAPARRAEALIPSIRTQRTHLKPACRADHSEAVRRDALLKIVVRGDRVVF